MRKIFLILCLSFSALISFSQGIVPRSNSSITVQDARLAAKLNFYGPHTHGLTLNGGLDSVGAIIYEDSSQHIWYRDTILSGGHKWSMVLKFGDIPLTDSSIFATNYRVDTAKLNLRAVINTKIALSNLSATAPIVYNPATGNISCPTCGTSGGGIVSLNGLAVTTQTFSTGSAGTDFGIFSSGSVHTFNIPTGSASNRGLISTTDWTNFASKQPQLNGTGFVKATGTTISYDNNTYYLASNPNNYITLTSISALAPVLYNNSTGVFSGDTTTGLSHFATQAYVLAHQSSGTITGSGNLSPLFTTSIVSNTIVFALSNAAANSILGNNTGSLGAPAYFVPTATTLNGWFGGTLAALGGTNNWTALNTFTTLTTTGTTKMTGLLSGGINDSIVTWNASTGTLGVVSRNFSLFAIQGLGSYGTSGDSIGLGLTPFFQPDTLRTAGFPFLITGLPNKTYVSTDSSIIQDNTGKLLKVALPSLTTTGTSGAATFNPATGVLNIPNYATSGGNPFADNAALVKNNADNTKLLILSAASISTGTTRTATFPDANITVADKLTGLGQFASTTSAQLISVMSDEQGVGALVFNNSPTLLQPIFNTTSVIGQVWTATNTAGAGNWATSGGSGGATQHNARGDSLLNSAGAILTTDNYTDHVAPIMFRYGSKNINIYAAKVADTTSFSAGADSAQCAIMMNMHSFGENAGYWDPHIINALRSTYHFAFGGPGYIGGQAIGVLGYNGYTTNGWTLRTSATTPVGRGPDDYSWIGTLNDTISVSPGPSTQDYLTFTTLTVSYYDTTGGGTFTVKVDGTVMATVNTSSGTVGFSKITFYNLINTTHRVTLTETVAGTTGVEVFGLLCFSSGKRSMYIENCSAGGTTIGNFSSLNPQLFGAELQALNPTVILADWTINSIKTNVDTALAMTQLDTIFHRYKAYVPSADIVYMGPTNYGFLRWGTPSEPIIAYTRSIIRLCLTDTIQFFDIGQLVGSFQYGITNGTIGGDSLHPTPQLFYVAAGELLNLIGAVTADSASTILNIFQNNGYAFNQSALGSFRYINFFNTGAGLFFDSVNNFKIRGTTGGDFINIAPSTTGTVFFTNSSGAAGHYNFDGAIAGPAFSASAAGAVAGVTSLTMSFATSGVPALNLTHTDASFAEYAAYLAPNLSTSNGTGYNYMGKTTNSTNSIFYGYLHKGNTNNAAFWDVGGGTSTGTNMVLNASGSLGLGLTSYTTAVNASALLDMESTTLGLLPPVQTLAQFTAIGSKATSLLVALSDSGGRLTMWTGSKIVTYVTSDQLGSSGSTPTFQQVLTSGSTLTGSNTINTGTSAFVINSTSTTQFSGIQLQAQTGTGGIEFLTGSTTGSGIFLGGSLFYGNPGIADANLTMSDGNPLFDLRASITANRTITLPSATTDVGRLIIIHNGTPSGGFTWSFSSTVVYPDGSTITTLKSNTVYILQSLANVWTITSEYGDGLQEHHTIFTPTTGGTVTSVNNQNNIINPAGTIATLTIALPTAPVNNDVVKYTFTQAVTAITYSGGTVVGVPTSATLGGQWTLNYDAGTTTWY